MKILTTILTCADTQTRANACLDTWIQDIQTPHDYVFYGDKTQSQSMDKTWNCTPDAGERRSMLPEKTYKMLRKSLDYKWDFLFKCDDDTFVHFHKLVDFLGYYDSSLDLYFGCKIVNPFEYAQGGAGYILTRGAVIKCIESLKHFYKDQSKNKIAEDYSVGLALREQGVMLTAIDRLITPNPKSAKQSQSVCIDHIVNKNKITTHYVQPTTMLSIYKSIT